MLHFPGDGRRQQAWRFRPCRSCTYFITVFSCCSLMHGPMSVEGSRPSPTLSAFTRATNFSTNSPYTFLWTATRLAAVQRWPVVPKPPHTAPSTARSRLASSITMMMFLPPISRWHFLKVGAHAWLTMRPTSVEPVKLTKSDIVIIREAARRRPGPSPNTTFITPRGRPASFERLHQIVGG